MGEHGPDSRVEMALNALKARDPKDDALKRLAEFSDAERKLHFFEYLVAITKGVDSEWTDKKGKTFHYRQTAWGSVVIATPDGERLPTSSSALKRFETSFGFFVKEQNEKQRNSNIPQNHSIDSLFSTLVIKAYSKMPSEDQFDLLYELHSKICYIPLVATKYVLKKNA